MTVNILDEIFKETIESFLIPELQDTITIINSRTNDDKYTVIVTISHMARKNTLFLMPYETDGFGYGMIDNLNGCFITTDKVDFTLTELKEKFKLKTNLDLGLVLHLSAYANKKINRIPIGVRWKRKFRA